MYGRLHSKIWIIAVSVFTVVAAQPRIPEQLPTVLPKYAFVSGAASGIDKLATPWANRWIQWAVQSEAGALGRGGERTDEQGRLSLEFEVPDVRAAVHMGLTLKPEGLDEKAVSRLDLVVLPKDPFADVRQSLGKLGIGLLPSKITTATLNRSGLGYVQLQHDMARGSFKGNVVILGSLVGENREVTRRWIGSLPAGTCLVVVNDGADKESAFWLVEYLKAEKPLEKSSVFWDRHSPIWTDLAADWMGLAICPPRRLAEPKGLTALKILAGHMAEDGSVYPLVMECTDFGGRRWLIWNLPQLPAENDPRWDLLLRNSLLWAQSQIQPVKSPENAEVGHR